MRIAILTFHRAYNCGAMLQAWALKTVLERMGHEVEFPDCNDVGNVSRFGRFTTKHHGALKAGAFVRWCYMQFLSIGTTDMLRWCYNRFRDRYLPCRKIDVSQFNERYDLVIIGSDQVWNKDIPGAATGVFVGEGIEASIPMIGYAISLGDKKIESEELCRLSSIVSRFSVLSFREPGPWSAPCALDPTLLIDRSDYSRLEHPRQIKYPYLYVYGQLSARLVAAAKQLATRLGVRLVYTPMYHPTRYKSPIRLCYRISPDYMLTYIRDAAYVLTQSFHGTIFSILYGKRFLSVGDGPSGRSSQLLVQFGLADRYFSDISNVDRMASKIVQEMPNDLLQRLYGLRASSLRFLGDAIGNVSGRQGGGV